MMSKYRYKKLAKAAISMLVILQLAGCGTGVGDDILSSEDLSEDSVIEESSDEISSESSENASNNASISDADLIGGELEDVELIKDNKFSCTFDGIEHDFIVDLPTNENTEDSPLVIMLHGYGQNAESFRLTTGFEKDANPQGYTVVYVTGAKNSNDATSAVGWNSGLGDSENRDVAFLVALAEYIQKEYGTDSERTYAVGFSNGGFMTHRLAVQGGEIFSAVVSVSGMLPESVWEVRPDSLNVGVFQVTGEKDDVVPKHADGSADSSPNPAIEDVMDYYVSANAMTEEGTEEVGKASTLTKYSSNKDDEFGAKRVWNLSIKDGRHSWPDEGVTGININELILEYLSE